MFFQNIFMKMTKNKNKKIKSAYSLKSVLLEKVACWKAGRDCSSLPPVEGVNESAWTADIVTFPASFTAKDRKAVHEVASELFVHHYSTGIGDCRCISLSLSGNFGPLIARVATVENERSSFYNSSVLKPATRAWYYAVDESTRATRRSMMRSWTESFKRDDCFSLRYVDTERYLDQVSFPLDATPERWSSIGSTHTPTGPCLRSLNDIDAESLVCTFVSTVDQLERLGAELDDESCNVFAFDVEMHSFRSYHGLTCLIQICVNSNIYVVDAISLWDYIGIYLGPAFESPRIVKVGHSIAAMDVPAMFRDFGIVMINTFDTQEAVFLLSNSQIKPGLSSMLELLGRRPDFSAEMASTKERLKLSDWRQRPLSDEMMQYAAADVRHLVGAYYILCKALTLASRMPSEPFLADITAIPSPSTSPSTANPIGDSNVVAAISGCQPAAPSSKCSGGYSVDHEGGVDGVEMNDGTGTSDIQIEINPQICASALGCVEVAEEDALWDGWGEGAGTNCPEIDIDHGDHGDHGVESEGIVEVSHTAEGILPVPRPLPRCSEVTVELDLEGKLNSSAGTGSAAASSSSIAMLSPLTKVFATTAELCFTHLWAARNETPTKFSKCSTFKQRKNAKKAPLSEKSKFVFEFLFNWREDEAMKRDESPTYICPPNLLMIAAERCPKTIKDLIIIWTPLPRSMRRGNCLDEAEARLGPVDLISAIVEAEQRWAHHQHQQQQLQYQQTQVESLKIP